MYTQRGPPGLRKSTTWGSDSAVSQKCISLCSHFDPALRNYVNLGMLLHLPHLSNKSINELFHFLYFSVQTLVFLCVVQVCKNSWGPGIVQALRALSSVEGRDYDKVAILMLIVFSPIVLKSSVQKASHFWELLSSRGI